MQNVSQRRGINAAKTNQKGEKKMVLALNTQLPLLTLPSERERPESPGHSPFLQIRKGEEGTSEQRTENFGRLDHVLQFLQEPAGSSRNSSETSCGRGLPKQ